MSVLQYNEIREKKIIIHDDEPCEVIESHVARTQQRKPQNQVKLRSLISGKTFAATFHASDSTDEADVSKKEILFLYHNRGEYWFCEPSDRSKRFMLDGTLLGKSAEFLKENTTITALVWTDDDDNEKIIKVTLPIKVDLKVTEAHPAVKGDTAKGGNKQVVLETGATINVPMFVKEGDIIRINTETGEYTDRLGSNF